MFVNQRLIASMLDQFEKSGVELAEIFCARQHFDYHDRSQMLEIGAWFRNSAMKLHSIHAPMYRDTNWGRSGAHAVVSITELDKSRRVDACDEIKRAIEIAEHAPFRYVITHLGVAREEFDERRWDAAFSSIEHLRMFARQRGADLVLENIPNELATPERLVEFLRYTHMDDLGLCFDCGHAHMAAGVAASFEKMKPHVRTTHLHDNLGEKDEHLFPFEGGIDWPRTVADLAAAPHPLPLLLEIREFPEVKDPLARAAEVFRKFEEIAAAPRHS